MSGIFGVKPKVLEEQFNSLKISQDDHLEQISFIAQEAINSELYQEEDETLEGFLDPVTFELMENPVVTSSGRSYEKSTLENIINNGDGLEPFTRQPLMLPLRLNRSLKNAIEQWKKSSSLTKEKLNQIIKKAGEAKRKQIAIERRIKEKNDAINEFHEELFAQKPEESSYDKKSESFSKEESKEKEEMREMREQMRLIMQQNIMLQQQMSNMNRSIYNSSGIINAPSENSIVPTSFSARFQATSLPKIAFGKDDWNRYCGDVGVESPLPRDMKEILKSPCPFWEGKRVEDTHILVFIPQKVNGIFLTLNSLEELIQRPRGGGYATTYRGGGYARTYTKWKHKCKDYSIRKGLGDQYTSWPHWVLMTKEVLPDSRKKCYRDQCNLVKNYQERIGLACAIPHVLEAVVSILMHYVKTGERLYPETYTRCQEMAKMWDGKECHVTIGGFSLNGFGIFFGKDVTDAGGVANIREF